MSTSSSGFNFRQFYIRHDRCSLKVGTDGILLGAWTAVQDARRGLDVGTGCGLLALMLAQRNQHAQIDAIEIDSQASNQARQNAKASPWPERIAVFHTSLQKFARCTDGRELYDLIVCNPPFFAEGTRRRTLPQRLARHDDRLFAEQLMESASRLLAPTGHLTVIVPHDRVEQTTELASVSGFAPRRCCAVRSFPHSQPVRELLEFSRVDPGDCVVDHLSIYQDTNVYSSRYQELTGEFYLETTAAFMR